MRCNCRAIWAQIALQAVFGSFETSSKYCRSISISHIYDDDLYPPVTTAPTWARRALGCVTRSMVLRIGDCTRVVTALVGSWHSSGRNVRTVGADLLSVSIWQQRRLGHSGGRRE